MGEDRIVEVQGRGKDPFVEDGISQDVDQENLLLGNREVEEMDGDFVGGSA